MFVFVVVVFAAVVLVVGIFVVFDVNNIVDMVVWLLVCLLFALAIEAVFVVVLCLLLHWCLLLLKW